MPEGFSSVTKTNAELDKKAKEAAAARKAAAKKKTKVKVKPPKVGASSFYDREDSAARAKAGARKGKKPPIPVLGTFDQTWDQTFKPPLPKKPEPWPYKVPLAKKPPRRGGSRLPRTLEYYTPENLFLKNADRLTLEDKRRIERDNQRVEKERRERLAAGRRRANGILRLVERGAGPDEIAKHVGKNQSVEDFVMHGKRDYPGKWDYTKAFGSMAFDAADRALKWAPPEDWIGDVPGAAWDAVRAAPGAAREAPGIAKDALGVYSKFRRWQTGQAVVEGTLKLMLGAATAKNSEERVKLFMDATEWVDPTVEYGLGSEIAKAIRGEPFNEAMFAAEVSLAAVPIKGLPSVGAVVIRALAGKSLDKSLIMTGRNAYLMQKALNKLFEENPERAQLIKDAIASGDPEQVKMGNYELHTLVAENRMHFREVWSERLNEWVTTEEPSAGNFLGRAGERVAEHGRKAAHRTPLSGPLSALKISKTGDEKIFEEVGRTSRQTVKPLLSADAKRVVKLGKRLSKPEQYALIIIAEGGGPEAQARWAEDVAQKALANGNKREAAAQMTHAAMFRAAAPHVVQGGDGKWYIAETASTRLKKIEEIWPDVQGQREDLYEALGILSREQMDARIQQPGRMLEGGRRVDMTEGDIYDLSRSPHRERIAQDVRDLDIPEEEANALLALHDSAALNLWRQAIKKAKNELKFLQKAKNDGEYLSAEQEARLRELASAKHNKAWESLVPKDLYYQELGAVWRGFPKSVKAQMQYEDFTRNLLSGGSGMTREDVETVIRLQNEGSGLEDLMDYSKVDPGKNLEDSAVDTIEEVTTRGERLGREAPEDSSGITDPSGAAASSRRSVDDRPEALGEGGAPGLDRRGAEEGLDRKPSWWDDPSDNSFFTGTKGEEIEDWLERHSEVQRLPDGRYRFYHAAPKGGSREQAGVLREGSLLEADPESAAFYAARDRDLTRDQVVVWPVDVHPEQIKTGQWASLREDYRLGSAVSIVDRRQAPNHRGVINSSTTAGVTYGGRAGLGQGAPPEFQAAFLRDHPDAQDFLAYIAIGENVLEEGAGAMILWHEMAHYTDRAFRAHGLGKYAQELAKIGTNPDGSRNAETWAVVLEKFIHDPTKTGLVGREKEALIRFGAFAADLYNEASRRNVLYRLYDRQSEAMLRRADAAAMDRVRDLFDALFTYHNPRKGYRFVGAEDYDQGRFYLMMKRGLPVSWRQPIARAREYQHAFSTMFGGGKRAMTLFAGDKDAQKQWLGFLKEQGFWKGKASDAIGESGMKAARVGTVADVRRRVLPLSTKTPVYADDILIREDLSTLGQANPEIRKALDLLEDMELGKRRVDYSELEGIDINTIEQIRIAAQPNEVDGKPVSEILEEMMNDGVREIPGFVWVSREGMESAGLLASPQAIQAQKNAWVALYAGGSIDTLNNIVKLGLLQLNPSYYTMNFLGNSAMLLSQQGPFALANGWHAARLSSDIGEQFATYIDELMGAGIQSLAQLRWQGDPTRYGNALNQLATVLVDRIPRRAAWMYEARRIGIDDPDVMTELLTRARAGDEQALKEVNYVTRRAKDALVDYDRLNDFERKYLARTLIFYPWVKGATRWTLRFPMEHPIQAMAFAAMYVLQQRYADEELGENRPYYQDLAVPLGVDVERGGEEYPLAFNPKQLFTWTTPYEYLNSLYGFATGESRGQPIAEMLSPVGGALVTALSGRRSFDDREVPRTFGTFLRELFAKPPLWTKIENLGKDTEKSNRLYPRSTQDKAIGVGFGSLAPFPYNTEKSNWLGMGQRGKTPEEDVREDIDKYRAAFEEDPPIEVVRGYETKAEWKYMLAAAHQEKPDLSDEELARLKFELLVRHSPDLRDASGEVEDALSRGMVSEVTSWIERELGWNRLERVTRDRGRTEKAKKETAGAGAP